jgi:hypothetical protein
MDANYILRNVSFWSSFLPVIGALIRIKSFKGYNFPLLVYFILAMITEIVGAILFNRKINNIFLLHFFSIFEFALILQFFKSYFGIRFNSKLYYLLLVIFGITFLINLAVTGLTNYNALILTFESIVFTACSMFFFYNVMRNVDNIRIYRTDAFWYSCAILVFFSVNGFFYPFILYLHKYHPGYVGRIWGILHGLVNSLFNILLFIGVCQVKREKT